MFLVLALAVVLTLGMAVVAASGAPVTVSQETAEVATETAGPDAGLGMVAVGACLLMLGAIAGGVTRARRDPDAAQTGH